MTYDFKGFLKVAREIDGEIQAYCPFHDDRRPSFSANIESGLWICHAGCGQGNFEQFLSHIGGRSTALPQRDSSGKVVRYLKDSSFKKVASYEYMDRDFSYHLRVTRLENSKGEKTFFQEHRDFSGRWIKGGAMKESLPYLYHEWASAEVKTVYLVEGEKCVEFLKLKGLAATTVPGGASRWMPHYSQYFRGKRVIIIPDNDDPGRKFASEAFQSLASESKVSVVILSLPGLVEGQDVVDWLSQNKTVNDLLELIPQA